jgi:hypothetical protein
VKELVQARRAGVLAVAAAVGALVATPAFADVTVSPNTSVQGDGADFKFHVTNTGAKPIGSVTLTLPADAPVAEAYPLSNPNWAPKIQTIKLTTPLTSTMTGIPETETTGGITWIAMPGLALQPGRSDDLMISLGPMPTLSSYKFTVTTKYTDGTQGPAMTPPVVKLSPATAQQQAVIDQSHAGHAGHDAAAGGDTGTTADDPDAAQFAKVVADATRGPSIWSIIGWVVAAAGLLGGAWLMFRSRHRAEEDEEPEEDEVTLEAASDSEPEEAEEADEKEPVAAGKWSLKE